MGHVRQQRRIADQNERQRQEQQPRQHEARGAVVAVRGQAHQRGGHSVHGGHEQEHQADALHRHPQLQEDQRRYFFRQSLRILGAELIAIWTQQY